MKLHSKILMRTTLLCTQKEFKVLGDHALENFIGTRGSCIHRKFYLGRRIFSLCSRWFSDKNKISMSALSPSPLIFYLHDHLVRSPHSPLIILELAQQKFVCKIVALRILYCTLVVVAPKNMITVLLLNPILSQISAITNTYSQITWFRFSAIKSDKLEISRAWLMETETLGDSGSCLCGRKGHPTYCNYTW